MGFQEDNRIAAYVLPLQGDERAFEYKVNLTLGEKIMQYYDKKKYKNVGKKRVRGEILGIFG